MVDHDGTVILRDLIQLLITRGIELVEDLGGHERGELRAPVVVREDHVDFGDLLKVFFQQIHAPVGDVVEQIIHLIRVLQQECQAVLERHEAVGQLEGTGNHERRHEDLAFRDDLSGLLAEGVPVRIDRVKVRAMHVVSPVLDVLDQDVLRIGIRDSAGLAFRPVIGDAPAVHAASAL